MWLTDLLRKITKGPNVGETFRDYIGCYVYGTENGSARAEYVGAPATLEQLEVEVRRYLEDFLSTQKVADSEHIATVKALLAQLPEKLAAHVASDMKQPFVTLSEVDLFIRTGVRERRKENGRFVE